MLPELVVGAVVIGVPTAVGAARLARRTMHWGSAQDIHCVEHKFGPDEGRVTPILNNGKKIKVRVFDANTDGFIDKVESSAKSGLFFTHPWDDVIKLDATRKIIDPPENFRVAMRDGERVVHAKVNLAFTAQLRAEQAGNFVMEVRGGFPELKEAFNTLGGGIAQAAFAERDVNVRPTFQEIAEIGSEAKAIVGRQLAATGYGGYLSYPSDDGVDGMLFGGWHTSDSYQRAVDEATAQANAIDAVGGHENYIRIQQASHGNLIITNGNSQHDSSVSGAVAARLQNRSE